MPKPHSASAAGGAICCDSNRCVSNRGLSIHAAKQDVQPQRENMGLNPPLSHTGRAYRPGGFLEVLPRAIQSPGRVLRHPDFVSEPPPSPREARQARGGYSWPRQGSGLPRSARAQVFAERWHRCHRGLEVHWYVLVQRLPRSIGENGMTDVLLQ